MRCSRSKLPCAAIGFVLQAVFCSCLLCWCAWKRTGYLADFCGVYSMHNRSTTQVSLSHRAPQDLGLELLNHTTEHMTTGFKATSGSTDEPAYGKLVQVRKDVLPEKPYFAWL